MRWGIANEHCGCEFEDKLPCSLVGFNGPTFIPTQCLQCCRVFLKIVKHIDHKNYQAIKYYQTTTIKKYQESCKCANAIALSLKQHHLKSCENHQTTSEKRWFPTSPSIQIFSGRHRDELQNAAGTQACLTKGSLTSSIGISDNPN